MADSSRDPESVPEPDPAAIGRDGQASAGMPRWVKVILLVGLALALLFAVVIATGVGGDHGPGRHSGEGSAPSSAVDEAGNRKPPVVHNP